MNMRPALMAAATAAVLLSACSSGAAAGGTIPDGWTAVEADELHYAVPDAFTELDPPRDPQRIVEHYRGDPDDGTNLELIGVYRSSSSSTTGDEVTLDVYSGQLFGLRGMVEGAEDMSTGDVRDVEVAGAEEAQVMTVTHEESDLTVEQTVVLVRTEEWIYDLRYLAVADLIDADIAETLPDTVALG